MLRFTQDNFLVIQKRKITTEAHTCSTQYKRCEHYNGHYYYYISLIDNIVQSTNFSTTTTKNKLMSWWCCAYYSIQTYLLRTCTCTCTYNIQAKYQNARLAVTEKRRLTRHRRLLVGCCMRRATVATPKATPKVEFGIGHKFYLPNKKKIKQTNKPTKNQYQSDRKSLKRILCVHQT